MEEANRDVFPSDATRSVHPDLGGLLSIPVIDDAFARRDAQAVSAKRVYHRLGRLAITLIALSATYTVGDALGIVPAAVSPWMSLLAVACASLGIGLQAYIILTRQKEKWLMGRFAVERLRSLKFQAYRAAHLATDPATLTEIAHTFAAREVARLDDELLAGISAIGAFDPSRAVSPLLPGDAAIAAKPAHPPLASAALTAFSDLRIAYQKRFAQSEIARMSGRRRVFESTQDMIYLAAAAFAFLALLAKAVEATGTSAFPTHALAWIDFLAVTLFIAGASKSIMDNASIEEQSRSRYAQYIRDIEAVALDASQKGARLPQIVDAMETVALGELDLFCRAAERISYRL